MKFKKRLRVESGLRQIDIAPLIDCIFLLLVFFMLTSNFIVMPGINVKLPKAVTSEEINTQTLVIVVSSEDILYCDGEPVTLAELKGLLKKKKNNSIFIKSDRDASLGVVVKIWDLCKKEGIEKIGIATTNQE
ncbi:MAG: biopolymer transporter ExbD [Candidatus Omnitrophica bacterium]|nr:biopolymer transporter ExbD [Candidatus Omnitrophota bacterium]